MRPQRGARCRLRYHDSMRIAHLHLLGFLTICTLLPAATPETLIENPQVRVVRAVDLPHSPGQLHKHERNRVMIYLQAGSETITSADGKKQNLTWKAGEARWSPAGGMHTSEITSDAPVTIIEVELKKEGNPSKQAGGPLDPVKLDPQTYKVEFENSQVRVLRVKMAPQHHVPMHEHALDRVVVYLTDQNSSMTAPDGKTDVAKHKAGEVSWGLPTRHQEVNLNDKPMEVVVAELKY